MALCDQATIRSEQLFLHQEDFSSRGCFNLLELPIIRRIDDQPQPYLWPRIVITLTLLATLTGTLAGGRPAVLANQALWALWWPALLVLVACGARIWCSLCSLQSLGQLLVRSRMPHLPLPKIAKQAAPWLGLVGTLAILSAEQFSGMRHNPSATVTLLLALLSGTLLGWHLHGQLHGQGLLEHTQAISQRALLCLSAIAILILV